MVCPLPFLLLLFYPFTFLPFYLFTFLSFYLFILLPFKNINQAKYPVLVKLSFFVLFARFVFVLPSSGQARRAIRVDISVRLKNSNRSSCHSPYSCSFKPQTAEPS